MNDWEKRYKSGDTGWDRGGASPALSQWLDAGPEPCRILIPGCGRGHEALELARLDFDVTAVDIAPSATTHLERQLAVADLSAKIVLGDLFAYSPEQPFDAVYEQTCLCAIQPQQRQAYEAKLRNWLRPAGQLFALFMQTGLEDGPPFHCDLLAMRHLFADKHWRWPESEPLFVPHRNGRFELGYRLIRA